MDKTTTKKLLRASNAFAVTNNKPIDEYTLMFKADLQRTATQSGSSYSLAGGAYNASL